MRRVIKSLQVILFKCILKPGWIWLGLFQPTTTALKSNRHHREHPPKNLKDNNEHNYTN